MVFKIVTTLIKDQSITDDAERIRTAITKLKDYNYL